MGRLLKSFSTEKRPEKSPVKGIEAWRDAFRHKHDKSSNRQGSKTGSTIQQLLRIIKSHHNFSLKNVNYTVITSKAQEFQYSTSCRVLAHVWNSGNERSPDSFSTTIAERREGLEIKLIHQWAFSAHAHNLSSAIAIQARLAGKLARACSSRSRSLKSFESVRYVEGAWSQWLKVISIIYGPSSYPPSLSLLNNWLCLHSKGFCHCLKWDFARYGSASLPTGHRQGNQNDGRERTVQGMKQPIRLNGSRSIKIPDKPVHVQSDPLDREINAIIVKRLGLAVVDGNRARSFTP